MYKIFRPNLTDRLDKIEELAVLHKNNRPDVVRRAIDEYYDKRKEEAARVNKLLERAEVRMSGESRSNKISKK